MQCCVTSQSLSTHVLNKYWKDILEWKSLKNTGCLINGTASTNKWDGLKTNKTCGLAKNALYSVLLLMAKAGSMWPVSFGVLALLVNNYWFV